MSLLTQAHRFGLLYCLIHFIRVSLLKHFLSVTEYDVVDGDEDQLYHVSDESHYEHTHNTCLQNLGVFSLVRPGALVHEHCAVFVELVQFVDH